MPVVACASQEWQVCQVSVGVLGDVCRAIEEQVAPFVQPVMAVLLRNLESNDVQRTVKPQILSAFGDVALAIGDRFEGCLPPCLHMLQSAQVRWRSLPAPAKGPQPPAHGLPISIDNTALGLSYL